MVYSHADDQNASRAEESDMELVEETPGFGNGDPMDSISKLCYL
jgi:hypothetical protein